MTTSAQTQTLTAAQVAERLRCSVKHVRKLIQRGELVACNIGTSRKAVYRVREYDLDTFLSERNVIGVCED